MSKEKYEAVKNPKTSEDWNAQANYLKQQLEAARKAQRAAAKQEERPGPAAAAIKQKCSAKRKNGVRRSLKR